MTWAASGLGGLERKEQLVHFSFEDSRRYHQAVRSEEHLELSSAAELLELRPVLMLRMLAWPTGQLEEGSYNYSRSALKPVGGGPLP